MNSTLYSDTNFDFGFQHHNMNIMIQHNTPLFAFEMILLNVPFEISANQHLIFKKYRKM